MKKVYTKPTATFESFMLSSNISAGCAKVAGIEANFGSYETCYITQNGWKLFLSLRTCDFVPQGSDLDSFCYDIPTSELRIFNS
jgi:hypothetical protein